MNYYSDIAEGYDELHGAEQDRKLQQFLDRVTLNPHSTLLDVGCATGRSAQLLDVQWFGVEPAKGLIEQAPPEIRERIKHAKGELPFPEAGFDTILSLTCLQNYDDIPQGIREMVRVCKPNGLLLISFLKKAKNAAVIEHEIRTLHVEDFWEEQHDKMFICRRKV